MPGKGGRGPLARDVQVSKKIAWLLRHGAEKEGLELGHGGFIGVSDVLANRNLKPLKVTFDELRAIVQDNDKQRFTMVLASSLDSNAEPIGQTDFTSNNPKDYLIRANQGHSLKVESEGLLQPITAQNLPDAAIHGTTHSAWPQIVASGGLKPMTRNHVHFASGPPAGFISIVDKETTEEAAAPVISGMRKSSTILVYLDISKAMEAGIKFWLSDNGVILSEGNADGILPLEYFKLVEDRTGEGVLVQDGNVVKEAPASWTGKNSGRK
ncbi:tRNA 2'-phosphotransferase 1 [Fulvia fulva]|uniref:2'-phosphotransferase n=1 Tax=Passalora fulva TaxID=5499 RepID=A0A9Q8L623_PASFU|nr:tRNA 2'-phosphotransferase 1 [Fulvia fulva]KAK4634416.1 tRNA 2'-phosphotransferase 1 [Fulvia fulva]KAK4638466.1 tRNA 2'-phosphotransferase 1 [Fulvia fulva]UJO11530.1 tRNA 2'-phosphotransferase 1 [Fulvia fulva]WPV09216.1 tRNA 2'-phosphotransferase 1 [Fulvia fulva]WPV24521.1 tRNA 2'-phosphotransferase 1 [Fulvia fulva]